MMAISSHAGLAHPRAISGPSLTFYSQKGVIGIFVSGSQITLVPNIDTCDNGRS